MAVHVQSVAPEFASAFATGLRASSVLSRHLGQGTNFTMSQRHDQVQNKLGDGNSGFLSPTASSSFQNVR